MNNSHSDDKKEHAIDKKTSAKHEADAALTSETKKQAITEDNTVNNSELDHLNNNNKQNSTTDTDDEATNQIAPTVQKKAETKKTETSINDVPSQKSAGEIMPKQDMNRDNTNKKVETENENKPIIVKQSGGKGMAFGALVLAILAIGASGFLFVQGQYVLNTQQLSFNQKIDNAALGENKNALLLQNSLARLDQIELQVQQLQQQAKKQDEQITQANKAYQELVKGRIDWLVDEVEAALNLAAQQLIISGNVPVALNILQNIDMRLARFDQPQLLPIKKAISQDINTLKNQPYLDVASTSLRLNRLESSVSSLPLAIDNNLKPGDAKAMVVVNSNDSWWQKTWRNTVNALSNMIEIRHLNSNDSMLMSPEQIFFIRENLQLRLMDARMALIQKNGEIYSSDLTIIESTVRQYFDMNSAAAQAWLQELAQLKSLDIQNTQDSNVLSASLSAISDYQKQQGIDANAGFPELSASEPSINASEATEKGLPSQEKSAHKLIPDNHRGNNGGHSL